jgi:hypothetical protein
VILPIRTLFGRSGLPGAGVPAFSIGPDGQIVSAADYGPGQMASVSDWDAGASTTPGGATPVVVTDSGVPVDPGALVDTGAAGRTHGQQVWNRQGSYRYESAFDRWRRAGKPTRGCGSLGDFTLPDGTPCVAGSTPQCMDSTQRILQAIAAGAGAASIPFQAVPGYATTPYTLAPGYMIGPTGQAVPITQSGSGGVWIVGVLIIGGLIWAVSRR